MKSVVTMVVAACALPIVATANTPPEITNVKASQRAGTKLVDITYDAADADGDSLKIRVEVSSDDGKTYSVPASSFSGDFGEGVTTGTCKKIVWDAGTDWDGEYSDKMKVKVFALDGHGFPGMAFGDEVPPGGFLMGQDGGDEGNGVSRHVCIPWSYWLSKYEVTNNQYCDFLNTAYAMGYVTPSGATQVFTSFPFGYPQSSSTICSIGDGCGIRWNVNKFEVVEDRGGLPANVTWYGAMAFAKFYGYDLPTDAEWEMAARGPDHDDENEHMKFPWGSDDATADSYCFTRSPGSRLCNVTNEYPVASYGLYNIMGNAAEWTRTQASAAVETYPNTESLTNDWNNPYASAARVVRGTYASEYLPNPIYLRVSAEQTSNGSGEYGFRVVRRYPSPPDISQRLLFRETFDSGTPSGWDLQGAQIVNDPLAGDSGSNKVLCVPKTTEAAVYLPDIDEVIVNIRFNELSATFQSTANLYVYSGIDKDHKALSENHKLSDKVSLSFAKLDDPEGWVWSSCSVEPVYPRKGYQHYFVVEPNEVPVYIDNVEVYVKEIVNP